MIIVLNCLLTLYAFLGLALKQKFGSKSLIIPLLLGISFLFFPQNYLSFVYEPGSMKFELQMQGLSIEKLFIFFIPYWLITLSFFKNKKLSNVFYLFIPTVLMFNIEEKSTALLILLALEQVLPDNKNNFSFFKIFLLISSLILFSTNEMFHLIIPEVAEVSLIGFVVIYFYSIFKDLRVDIGLNTVKVVLTGLVLKDTLLQRSPEELKYFFGILLIVILTFSIISQKVNVRRYLMAFLAATVFIYLLADLQKNFLILQLFLIIFCFYKIGKQAKEASPDGITTYNILNFYVNLIALIFLTIQTISFFTYSNIFLQCLFVASLLFLGKDFVTSCSFFPASSRRDLLVKCAVVLNVFLIWSING